MIVNSNIAWACPLKLYVAKRRRSYFIIKDAGTKHQCDEECYSRVAIICHMSYYNQQYQTLPCQQPRPFAMQQHRPKGLEYAFEPSFTVYVLGSVLDIFVQVD